MRKKYGVFAPQILELRRAETAHHAAEVLITAGPDAVPALIAATEARETVVRAAAVAILSVIGGPEALSAIERVAATDQNPVVQQALQQIAARPSRDDAPRVVAGTGTSSPSISAKLGAMSNQEAEDFLRELIDEADKAENAQLHTFACVLRVARLHEVLGADGVAASLLEAAHVGVPATRAAVASYQKSPSPVDSLFARVIGGVPHADAIGELVALLESGMPVLEFEAARALAGMSGIEAERAVIISAARSEGNAGFWASFALASMNDPAADGELMRVGAQLAIILQESEKVRTLFANHVKALMAMDVPISDPMTGTMAAAVAIAGAEAPGPAGTSKKVAHPTKPAKKKPNPQKANTQKPVGDSVPGVWDW